MNTEKNRIIGGTLYLVSTPLGNLSDISYRAVKVLSEVDFIAAEDTRVARKLTTALEIPHHPCIAYHEHNKREAGERIAEKLEAGESCALVTDAGTPAISDPGADIVSICIEKGIPVTAVPGCCAAIDALVLSGLDTRRFVFEGFLDTQKKAKRERLATLAGEIRTMIFYEAPHRIIETLELMREQLGDRSAAVCRELTKLNEQVLRGTLSEIIAAMPEVRGEFVIIVSGAEVTCDDFWKDMSIEEHVHYYETADGMERMQAIKAVAKDRRVAKNQIYRHMLELDT